MKIFRKTDICLLVLLLLASFLIAAGCGKKGTPTMKSFEKPDLVKDIRAVHRDGSINISWSYPGRHESIKIKGFRLYRAEGPGDYKEITKLPGEARRYADSNISLEKQYRYKLRVFSGRNIDSEDSASVTARPVREPDIPSGLSYRLTNKDVEIVWDKAKEGVFFNIYRRAAKGVYPAAPVNEKPLYKPFFRDALNLKDPVFYVVVAVKRTDIQNESGLSAELMIDSGTFVPRPPVDLRYVRSGGKGYLSWKDSDENWVRRYRVYRREGLTGLFDFVAEVNVPVYLDEDQVGEKTTYRVTAVGPAKESRPSAEVGVRQAAE
jgi:hypothetical protein